MIHCLSYRIGLDKTFDLVYNRILKIGKVVDMRKKLLRKEKVYNREILVYKDISKRRIPIAKPGFAMKSDKSLKHRNVRITVDNWDKMF